MTTGQGEDSSPMRSPGRVLPRAQPLKSLQGPSRLVKNSPHSEIKVPPSFLRRSKRKQTFTNWVRGSMLLNASKFSFRIQNTLWTGWHKSWMVLRLGPLILPSYHWACFQRNCLWRLSQWALLPKSYSWASSTKPSFGSIGGEQGPLVKVFSR